MLPARKIFGSVGRSGGGYNTVWSDWSPEGRRRRDLIMTEYEQEIDRLCGHYQRLESSMLTEGVRNPVIVTRGPPRKRTWEHIPPEMHDWQPSDLYIMETSTGGSRLWVAQKHNMSMPCFVNDWTQGTVEGMEIKSIDQARKFYKDPPRHLAINARLGLVESFDNRKVGHHLGDQWREDVLVRERAPIWISIMNRHGYRVDRLPEFVHDILRQAGIDQSRIS